VVLIQIRDQLLHPKLVRLEEPGDSWLTDHLGEVAVPLIAAINAGLRMPIYRNDEEVEQLGRMFPPGRFATFVFEFPNQEPLSWMLTNQQREEINRGFHVPRDTAPLVQWWRSP
jgi:hypothetical protein